MYNYDAKKGSGLYRKNNLKNVLHGFFLAIALTIAEPATTLPLIIHHFSNDVLLVGLFTSLLRGGAIVVQLFAAFYAQSFSLVMPYLRLVFLARFLSWLTIGLVIYFIGDKNPFLTLLGIGIALFVFSVSAGFGQIYFNEILAKVFSHQERGRSMANRQLFAAIGAIVSGFGAGFILERYPPPLSYAYLFFLSACLMAIGLIAFGSIQEPPKKSITQKEKSFILFLHNVFYLLRHNRALQIQIVVVLLSYSFLLSLSYIILQAQSLLRLSGWMVGGFITIQMIGALVGNLLYKALTPNYKGIMVISFCLAIFAFFLLLFPTQWVFISAFFLLGMAIDGFRIAGMNLLFALAPEDKRPVYIALQNTITSIGLFFAIPGGFLLKAFGYTTLYGTTLALLIVGLFFALKIDNTPSP